MSINGTNSEKMILTSDVPQGSLLGPRLFTIFVFDLKMEMSADDSTAYIVGSAVARGGAGGARAPPVFSLKSKKRPV